MTYVGATPTTGDFKKLDSITTSSATTFNLRQGGVAVYPQSANHCIVSLNGVIQAPVDAFTIVNDTIVFASSLASSDVINFILVLGNVNDIGTVSDDTVSTAKLQANSVTAAKFNADVISGQTELATTPADTDEFIISDSGVLKRIDYSHIKSGDNTPAFMVVMGTDDSIANSTFTKATFDTEIFDTDSAFASNKFTVPSGEGGKYVFFGHTYWTSIDDTNRTEQRIYKNGANAGGTSTGSQTLRWYSVGTNLDADIGWTSVLNLNAGDYIELYVMQTNGDTQTLYRETWLAGYKLNGV